MGLRIWMPLNVNNNYQQGLWNVYPTFSTCVTPDGDGLSYKFSGTTGNGIYFSDGGFMSNYINGKSWTIGAWVKTTETNTPVISLSYGLRMFAGSNASISLYNSSRTVPCYSGKSTTDGKWHHLMASYNVSTNQIKFYFDGELSNTANYTSGYTYSSSWTNGIYIGRDPNNSTANASYFFQGNMRDVRIYSHCLTDDDVKKLSLGLVCWYQFKQEDKSPNLIPNSKSISWAASTAGYNYKSYDYGMKFNTKYTLSGRVKVLSGTITSFTIYGCYPYSYINVPFDSKGDFSVSWTSPTTWDTTNTSTSIHKKLLIYNGVAGNTTSRSMSFEWIKLEEGDNPTKVWSDTPRLVEYDVSGMNYACSIDSTSLTPIYSEQSPVFRGSYDFSGSKKMHTWIPVLGNTYTFSWWGKIKDWSGKMMWGFSTGNRLNLYGGIYCNTGDGSSNPFKKPGTNTVITAPSINEWHHYVMTGDGTNVKLYVDGEHYGTATTFKGVTSEYIYFNGWDNGTSYCFNGNLSDFRVYLTSLSTDDVYSLYNGLL